MLDASSVEIMQLTVHKEPRGVGQNAMQEAKRNVATNAENRAPKLQTLLSLWRGFSKRIITQPRRFSHLSDQETTLPAETFAKTLHEALGLQYNDPSRRLQFALKCCNCVGLAMAKHEGARVATFTVVRLVFSQHSSVCLTFCLLAPVPNAGTVVSPQ